MEDKSNIILYIEESVLKKIDESKKETYRLLGRAFEELGETALYKSHIELGKHYAMVHKQVLAGGGVNSASLAADLGVETADILANLADAFSEEVADYSDDYIDERVSKFSVGELKVLSNKDNWFRFLGNSMIKHFINKINEQLNEVNLRKKFKDIIDRGGKTTDISTIKMLAEAKDKDSDDGVVYTSSTIMPRWNMGDHHNGEEILQKFNEQILSHLEIDGYSTNMDKPDAERAEMEDIDDKVQG